MAARPSLVGPRLNGDLSCAAIVSGDAKKRRSLGQRYGVNSYSYDDLDACFAQREVDAVYIALPNSMHRDCAVRAAHAGVHVLCEKPMAGVHPVDEAPMCVSGCTLQQRASAIALRLVARRPFASHVDEGAERR